MHKPRSPHRAISSSRKMIKPSRLAVMIFSALAHRSQRLPYHLVIAECGIRTGAWSGGGCFGQVGDLVGCLRCTYD